MIASSRRNEVENGRQVVGSQWIGINLMVVRSQRAGVDSRV